MSEGRFWVSTGDIRDRYEVVNAVAAWKVGFVEPDFAKAARDLVDNLAQPALELGANGVIWIQITPVDKGGGFGWAVYATGTAVRVSATAPVA